MIVSEFEFDSFVNLLASAVKLGHGVNSVCVMDASFDQLLDSVVGRSRIAAWES